MGWTNCVVTNNGVALLSNVLSGGQLTVTAAAGGSGVVPEVAMLTQTELVSKKQTLSLVAVTDVSNGKKIQIQIENMALQVGYTLNQVGIWAEVTGGNPVLFALLQDETGIAIPSCQAIPEFVLEFYAVIDFSNQAKFHVTVDVSALVSIKTLQDTISQHDKSDGAHQERFMQTGKALETHTKDVVAHIKESERESWNGKASLGTDGRLEKEQLPDIDCGFFDEDSTVETHDASSYAHAVMLVDGNDTTTQDHSQSLEEHLQNPFAHANLVLDGNIK